MGTQTSITFDTSFFKQESDVDDYVKEVLQSLGLKKRKDFNEKSAMSDYMKESLKGASKTKRKVQFRYTRLQYRNISSSYYYRK